MQGSELSPYQCTAKSLAASGRWKSAIDAQAAIQLQSTSRVSFSDNAK
jgi:hypothetical protein